MADCTNKSNIAKGRCFKNFGQVKTFLFFETVKSFTYANGALEATYIAEINAAKGERLYIPFPNKAAEITRTVEDAVIQTGNTGLRIKVRDGLVSYTVRFDGLTFEEMNRVKTFDGASLNAMAGTDKYVIGVDTGTQIKTFPVTTFVGEPMSPETQDNLWSINLYVNFEVTDDYFGVAIETTDFLPTELEGINDVTLTVISSDVSDQTVIVEATGQSDEPIVSLTTSTDWSVYLVAGSVARTITAVTNVGKRYTLTVTDLTAALHGITLKNQPTMTVKGFECQTPVTFTPTA